MINRSNQAPLAARQRRCLFRTSGRSSGRTVLLTAMPAIRHRFPFTGFIKPEVETKPAIELQASSDVSLFLKCANLLHQRRLLHLHVSKAELRIGYCHI